MKRKYWVIAGVAVLTLVALGAAAVGGAYLYLQHRNKTWLREALSAYEKGEWERAKGYFERYMPQDPRNADLLMKYADASLRLRSNRTGALQSASTAYLQILTHYPERHDVRALLIDLYTKLSAWSTLRYYTDEWLLRDPDNDDLLYYNALALDRLGIHEEAVEAYRKLVEKQTDRSDVYGSYARLLRDRGLEAKAEEVFAQARQLRPNDGHILADYARFLARKSTWPEVQHLLEQAVKLSPDDPDVLVAMAQAAMLRRQHDVAVEHLKKAVSVKPDGPTYLMMSAAYSYQGLIEEAINTLKNVDPFIQVDTPLLLITLADLQLGINAFDDAKQTIALYNSAYPDQLPINEYFAGKELLVRGEPSAAIKRLSSVVELRPGFALAQYTLAEAYLASGETELARNMLESYLAKNTGDERAQRLMAQRFGRPMSLESLVMRTEDLLDDQQPDAQRLTTMGTALLDAAVRHDTLAQHAELVKRALTRAIDAAPTEPDAHRVLADLALWQDDPSAAEAVVNEAIARGCREEDFAMLRAGIALGRGDTAAYEAIIAAAVASPEFDEEKYAHWALFLSQHNHYDEAQALLVRGIEKLTAQEAKAMLEVERATIALRHGDLDIAAQWLDAAEAQVPRGTALRRRFLSTRLQLAQSYLVTDAGPSGESTAQRIIDAAKDEDPGHPMMQVADGLRLLRATPPDLDGAEAMFERAAATDAANLGAQWGQAKVASLRGDYPRALMFVERAVALAPQVPALQLLQAEALLKTDRLFEAERVISRILEAHPDNVAAAQLLVSCHLARGHEEEAAKAFARFETLAAGNENYAAAVETLRSALMVASGDAQQAEEYLRATLEEHPDDVNAATNLATVIKKQGREDEARRLLTEFAEKRSSDPSVWVAVAQWWGENGSPGDLREASTALTRALLVDPEFIPAIRGMLSIRLRQGDHLEALGLCERYLLQNPDDAEMLNTKALLLSQSASTLGEALATANRAVELDDRNEFKGTRGVILVLMQQYERALRDLRPLASETGNLDPRVTVALAEAYVATNELALARQYLDAALARGNNGESIDRERVRRIEQALKRQESAA